MCSVTAFSQLNTTGVHFKLGMVDPAFLWISSLFGPAIFEERVIIRFSCQPSFIIQQINV